MKRTVKRRAKHSGWKRHLKPFMALAAGTAVTPAVAQQVFPADYPWNQVITNAPVAANSAFIIAHIGTSIRIHPDWGTDSPTNGTSPLYGIPYNVVHGNTTAKINVVIDNYPGESDIVSVPIPANAVIEGDNQGGPNTNGAGYNNGQRGDSHLIVWDIDNNLEYELFGASRPSDTTLFPNTNGDELAHTDGKWHAASESVWNFNSDNFRTLGYTSADAAGLSILAGLARPDEGLTVAQGGKGAINHAIRFTLPARDVNPQYIYPASHMVSESQSTNNLPMGGRLRLMNTPAVNTLISNMPPESQIVARAMQKYGLILADIGSAMYVTGVSASVDATNHINHTWDMNDILASKGLTVLTAGNFEVVNLTPIITGLSSSNLVSGSSLVITGQNFSGAAGHLSVFFGTNAASSVTVLSDTLVSTTVPNGSGTVDVTVRSGVKEIDNVSDNPNANVNAPIFGYGTSAITAADKFIYAPGNDQCSSAVALTNGLPYSMNTSLATGAGDPLVPCGPLGKGVWFTYTPTNHEQVTVSTCGSSFNTLLQVYTGTCGTLQRVAYGCNDDNGPACASQQASVVFEGFPGVTYHILAGGWNSATGNLQIVATSALVNDGCASAIPLYFGVPLSLSNTNASSSGDPTPVCASNGLFGKGVWFSFVSPVTGPVPISTCGSSFNTVLDVFTGTCGTLSYVTCNDDNGPECAGTQASVILNATAGTAYYILAGGYNSAMGELKILVGIPPTLRAGFTKTNLNLTWSNYYFPAYVLQQQSGSKGIGSGLWQDLLPNSNGSAAISFGSTNTSAFFHLVTP